MMICEKLYTRDFTLCTHQLWYYGEASDPKTWTDHERPDKPYIVFHHRDTATDAYYAQLDDGYWSDHEVIRLINEKPHFTEIVGKTFQARIVEVNDIIENEPVLTLKELKAFTSHIREDWQWFEALWESILNLEEMPERKGELDALLEVRKKTEKMPPATDAIIRKSIMNLYPSTAAYADVLLLEEIFNNALPSEKVLQERQAGFYYTDDKLFPNSAKEEIERTYGLQLTRAETDDTGEIHGQVAYPGKVTGHVRRLHGVKQLAEFQDGEILVAATTTPDLLPAMKKAAAIVSDEGGLVCHAAIVARELKIPCVIGTKVAMDVLRDGDLVEVDAEQGIVRKI